MKTKSKAKRKQPRQKRLADPRVSMLETAMHRLVHQIDHVLDEDPGQYFNAETVFRMALARMDVDLFEDVLKFAYGRHSK
jgi:hypothetical protein